MTPERPTLEDGKLSRMATELVWAAFLRVKNEESANKLLFRLQEALGREMHLTELARYWKDDAIFKAVFTTPLVAADERDALVEGLTLAATLAPSWEINNLVDPQRLSGWAHKGIAVSGVDAVGFDFIDAEASA